MKWSQDTANGLKCPLSRFTQNVFLIFKYLFFRFLTCSIIMPEFWKVLVCNCTKDKEGEDSVTGSQGCTRIKFHTWSQRTEGKPGAKSTLCGPTQAEALGKIWLLSAPHASLLEFRLSLPQQWTNVANDGCLWGSCVQSVLPACVFLTWKMGLVCVLGKAVGLLSHRIKSLRDRHLWLGCGVSLICSLPPGSCCVSSSEPNRRW